MTNQEKMWDAAITALGSKELADQWLNQPNQGLGGYVPIKLASSLDGTRLVLEALLRVEYGIVGTP